MAKSDLLVRGGGRDGDRGRTSGVTSAEATEILFVFSFSEEKKDQNASVEGRGGRLPCLGRGAAGRTLRSRPSTRQSGACPLTANVFASYLSFQALLWQLLSAGCYVAPCSVNCGAARTLLIRVSRRHNLTKARCQLHILGTI